jgi:hypothetical protein
MGSEKRRSTARMRASHLARADGLDDVVVRAQLKPKCVSISSPLAVS